jgi:hypothetical protein
MSKPGHKEPLFDNRDPADVTSHAPEEQLRVDEVPTDELHQPGDPFNRRDDQARETAGQIGLEESGMSPRQAAGVLGARAAKKIVEDSGRQRAAQRESEEARRQQDETEEIKKLLKS